MINVKNIYWMLAYAFRILNERNIEKMDKESFENIYELFSVMLTQELNKQIKRGLNKDYILKDEELGGLKGKILITESIKKNSFIKSKAICEYDEYSVNSYLNRIIKTAAMYLLKSNKIKDNEKVKKLRNTLAYLNGVNELDRKNINWSSIKYNKNNSSYKILTNISYLILDGLLLDKEDGTFDFRNYIDDQKMHRLYEKFILEYYKYHHKELKPSVPQIKWNVEENEFVCLLPKMQTDIVLDYNDKKLIIDAKYYSNEYQKNPLFNKDTYRSNNLYQIFTYVKNEDKNRIGNIFGMLLYAKTENSEDINSEFNMDGNTIIVSNLDLSKDFIIVSNKLEEIAKWFKNKK